MTRYSAEGDSEDDPTDFRRLYPFKRPRITEGSTRSNGSLNEFDAEESGVNRRDEVSDEDREVQSSEASPANSTPSWAPTTEAPRRESSSRDRSVSVELTLTDPDVLDCPICLEPLSAPVYQCDNGHLACMTCCGRMGHKCGSCALPIGYNRCRAIEKVIESIKIACPNKQHGCTELLPFNKKLDHEKSCDFVPCTCPHTGCDYKGPYKSLCMHFSTHSSTTCKKFFFDTVISINLDPNEGCVFLQERCRDLLFVLNSENESYGCMINLVCISPKKPFSYDLSVRDGESSIQLKTVVECVTEWKMHSVSDKYLCVPNDFFNEAGTLELELVIRKCR